jgi:hypothetical protein
MKRIVVGLFVGLSTFAIGTVAGNLTFFHRTPVAKVDKPNVPSCPVPDDLEEILNVDFCDLMRRKDRYDGRLVRFRAVMLAAPGYEPSHDHVNLGEPGCEPLLVVHDGFHLASRTCPEVMKALDSLLMRFDPVYPSKNAWVVVVGRFVSPKSTMDLDTGQSIHQSARFTIISIERASSIDDD